MKQICNLLSNAPEVHPGGNADIREEKRANGFVYPEFMVWDNGIGMSEELCSGDLSSPLSRRNPGNARNNVGSGSGSVHRSQSGAAHGRNHRRGEQKAKAAPSRHHSSAGIRDNQGVEWERKRQNLLRKALRCWWWTTRSGGGTADGGYPEDIGARTVWADRYQAVAEGEEPMPGPDVRYRHDRLENARDRRDRDGQAGSGSSVGEDNMIIMITAYD